MNEMSDDIKISPVEYEEAAVIAAEAGNEALSRLDWMTIQPKVIVDVGCRSGGTSRGLQTRYPDALVMAMDHDIAMAEYTHQTHQPALCAFPDKLPLRNHSVDMVFANLLLPFQADSKAIEKLLQEWRRVLRPEGLLMLTALGVDTLQQLRGIINPAQGPLLFDMHDGGDMLVQAGFADPVLDMDYVTLSYQESEKLWIELQVAGMLAGEVEPSAKARLLKTADGNFEVTFEVIQAHAFAPQVNAGYKPSEDGVTRIPLSHLRRAKS